MIDNVEASLRREMKEAKPLKHGIHIDCSTFIVETTNEVSTSGYFEMMVYPLDKDLKIVGYTHSSADVIQFDMREIIEQAVAAQQMKMTFDALPKLHMDVPFPGTVQFFFHREQKLHFSIETFSNSTCDITIRPGAFP